MLQVVFLKSFQFEKKKIPVLQIIKRNYKYQRRNKFKKKNEKLHLEVDFFSQDTYIKTESKIIKRKKIKKYSECFGFREPHMRRKLYIEAQIHFLIIQIVLVKLNFQKLCHK